MARQSSMENGRPAPGVGTMRNARTGPFLSFSIETLAARAATHPSIGTSARLQRGFFRACVLPVSSLFGLSADWSVYVMPRRTKHGMKELEFHRP